MSPTVADGRPTRAWVRDLIGVGWVVAAAIGVMVPALRHGLSLGEYDWLSHYGLLQQPGVLLHNGFAGDQINEMIPWTTLAWTQVHHGQLPLWNPYSALGMPLAFNWQSATFSLPNLIGYLFPVRFMYTVQVLPDARHHRHRRLLLGPVARAQCPRLCAGGNRLRTQRAVLRLARLADRIGGVVDRVAVRGDRPDRPRSPSAPRHRLLRGGVFAFAIFAGEPDTLVLLVIALTVFALVLLALRVKETGGFAQVWRPFRNLVIALATGTFLGAPLLLPGLQVVSGSIRNTGGSALNAQSALSVKYLFRTTFPWLIGAPAIHEYKYIGVIAIVLALAGLVFRYRQPEVMALGGVLLVTAVLVFVPAAIIVVNAFPGLHAVRLPRALNFFAFAIAMLSGVGLHVFMRSPGNKAVLRFIGAAFGAAGVALVAFWLTDGHNLSGVQHAIRNRGLKWLLIGVVAGLAVVAIDVIAGHFKWRLGHAEASTDRADEFGGSLWPETVDRGGAGRNRDDLPHPEWHGPVDLHHHTLHPHPGLRCPQASSGLLPRRARDPAVPVSPGPGNPGERQHRLRSP